MVRSITYSPRTSFINGYAKVEIRGELLPGQFELRAFAEAFLDRNGEVIALMPRLGSPQMVLSASELSNLRGSDSCEGLLR